MDRVARRDPDSTSQRDPGACGRGREVWGGQRPVLGNVDLEGWLLSGPPGEQSGGLEIRRHLPTPLPRRRRPPPRPRPREAASRLFFKPFTEKTGLGTGRQLLTPGAQAGPGSGRGSRAATVRGAEGQEDIRLALEGDSAVGEPLAALQVGSDVLEAHGLGARGG